MVWRATLAWVAVVSPTEVGGSEGATLVTAPPAALAVAFPVSLVLLLVMLAMVDKDEVVMAVAMDAGWALRGMAAGQ